MKTNGKTNKKRIAAMLMTGLMVCTFMTGRALPAAAATSGTCGEELTWSVDETGLLTISGSGYMEFDGSKAPWYGIKDSIRAVSVSENVESICYRAFWNCYAVETVEILGSTVDIEENAFESCSSLRSIQLPEDLDRIRDKTFYRCERLQNIEIPQNVNRIGNSAFLGCQNLEKIEIPEAVERIGGGAFSGCKNLKSIEISKNVEQIGGSAFANSGIESITVAEDNPYYCAINGSLYTKDKTKMIQYAAPKTETVFSIPDGVTEIASGAFGGAENLINIILPSTLEFIGNSAFYNCYGLTNMVIPSGVLEIGSSAFEGCKNLKKIEIPFSVTYIEECAFFLCNGLENVVYEGDQELWTEIEFGEENDALLHASIKYQNLNIYMQYDTNADKLIIIGNDNIEQDEAVLLVAAYKDNAVFSCKTLISCKIMIVPILTGESIARNLLQNIEGADRIQFMLCDGVSMMPLAKAIEKKY